jgi:integrase
VRARTPGPMAKKLHKLTARMVAIAKTPGRLSDGGNLYLAVTATGGKSWIFMYELAGKQREAGLGSAIAVTLAEAREKAAEYRSLLAKGVDPLSVKQAAAEAAKVTVPTFGEVACIAFAAKCANWSEVHKRQWQNSVARYTEEIATMPVDKVDDTAARSVLTAIWLKVPETARRVRARCEEIMDFARARNWFAGENPFRLKGHLAHVLPRRSKGERRHFPAMPYRDVPAYVAGLRKETSIPRLALEFQLLSAVRPSEARLAVWTEIDLDQKIWRIEASRMKAGAAHVVPLSDRSVEILTQLPHRSGLLFPGRGGKPMSSTTTLAKLLPAGASLHGFRSSFRDWCGEETSFPREIAEQALAHTTGSAVERAYRRGTALEKRRELMTAWSNFCGGLPAGNVVSLTKRG